MKTKLLFSFFIISIFAYAQKDKSFVFKQSIEIPKYDISQKKILNETEIAKKDWKFKIDHELIDGDKVIRFWPWNSSQDYTFYKKGKKMIVKKIKKSDGQLVSTIVYGPGITPPGEDANYNYEYMEEEGEAIFFHISKDVFDNLTEPYEKISWFKVQTGAVTIPVKIRPDGNDRYVSRGENDLNNERIGQRIRPFDFTGGVNVGLSLGLRADLYKDYHVVLVGGLNVSSENIDNSVLREINLESAESFNASSLTPFTGVVLGKGNAQITFLMGWDYLSGNISDNWVYQGKPWFGVGLGFSIFSLDFEDRSKTNDD